jgi:hypothetical protein
MLEEELLLRICEGRWWRCHDLVDHRIYLVRRL